MTTSGISSAPGLAKQRRVDWRGERTPVMVRLPRRVAERLGEAAHEQNRSVSETAAELLESALGSRNRP